MKKLKWNLGIMVIRVGYLLRDKIGKSLIEKGYKLRGKIPHGTWKWNHV